MRTLTTLEKFILFEEFELALLEVAHVREELLGSIPASCVAEVSASLRELDYSAHLLETAIKVKELRKPETCH